MNRWSPCLVLLMRPDRSKQGIFVSSFHLNLYGFHSQFSCLNGMWHKFSSLCPKIPSSFFHWLLASERLHPLALDWRNDKQLNSDDWCHRGANILPTEMVFHWLNLTVCKQQGMSKVAITRSNDWSQLCFIHWTWRFNGLMWLSAPSRTTTIGEWFRTDGCC